MQALLTQIKQLGLSNVSLLALVSSTSYQVIFYALVDGKIYQSNELAESGKIDILQLDEFYQSVASIIRQSKEFKDDKLNIVQVSETDMVTVRYEPLDCHVYALKKAWIASLNLS